MGVMVVATRTAPTVTPPWRSKRNSSTAAGAAVVAAKGHGSSDKDSSDSDSAVEVQHKFVDCSR